MSLKRKLGTVWSKMKHETGDVTAAPDDVLYEETGVLAGEAAEEAPIEREALARLRGLQDDEPDILAELATMFVEDARAGLETIQEALHKGDAPAVGRKAHTLKGGSGYMGARGLVDLCTQLEGVGASGDLSRCSWLLADIREELERVERALEDEIAGFGSLQSPGLRRSGSSRSIPRPSPHDG